jgi:anti-sigma B factor antagonist
VEIDQLQATENVTVLVPKGRLDVSAAKAFSLFLNQLVRSGCIRIVVDCGEITFIGSAGLGAIVGGFKLARKASGELRIARPQQQMRLVLDLSALTATLRPYASVEAAVASF